MVTTLRAKFDGKVFVPEDPVDLPMGETVTLRVESTPAAQGKTGLQKLMELAESYKDNPGLPSDYSAQHDHYLYGTPKRENP